MSGLDIGPGLPARLRGALGHALMRRGEEDALDALFRPGPLVRARAERPKPFVLSAEETARGLVVRLALFGAAERWRGPVFDALIDALAHGVAQGEEPGSPRRPLGIVSADWSRREGVAIPAPCREARLLWRTPLRIGPRRALGQRWADVIVSAAERVAGLAAWQGLAVACDLRAWRARASGLAADDTDIVPVRWERATSRNPGRPIPMMGYAGALAFHRPPPEVLTVLALGERTHLGGGAALGLGRYALACY